MRILFIGDVFGRTGRDLVRQGLPVLTARYRVDAVIANVENAASGAGITRETGDALLKCGIDVMTTGNHVWDRREALSYIGAEPRLLRPLNMAAAAPGRGVFVARLADGRPIGVINAMGRVFMPPVDNPFEATAEKIAMGWYLDGRVAAVVGTHTHVQTSDARVLPGGTAYITDVGMTGPHDSVIGMERAGVLDRFVTGLPVRMEPATGNPRLQAVVIDADERTGLARGIERLDWSEQDLAAARRAGDDAQPL